MLAIEFGMWRSVRSGGASGSITLGNGVDKLNPPHAGAAPALTDLPGGR
jgi:hypothetical protein